MSGQEEGPDATRGTPRRRNWSTSSFVSAPNAAGAHANRRHTAAPPDHRKAEIEREILGAREQQRGCVDSPLGTSLIPRAQPPCGISRKIRAVLAQSAEQWFCNSPGRRTSAAVVSNSPARL